MNLVELWKAIENFKAGSTVIISGPAGDYAPFDICEEDSIVYIYVCPIEDTPS
jgi:hypothetical protein